MAKSDTKKCCKPLFGQTAKICNKVYFSVTLSFSQKITQIPTLYCDNSAVRTQADCVGVTRTHIWYPLQQFAPIAEKLLPAHPYYCLRLHIELPPQHLHAVAIIPNSAFKTLPHILHLKWMQRSRNFPCPAETSDKGDCCLLQQATKKGSPFFAGFFRKSIRFPVL